MKRILLLLAAVPAFAASNDSLLGITFVQNKSGQSLGVPMQILLLLTLLTFLPAIIMSVTPFLRSIVVLHFLRQALGTQTVPSNQVLVGLAMFLASWWSSRWENNSITRAGSLSKTDKSTPAPRGTAHRFRSGVS